MSEFKHINEVKALGYDELKRREQIMLDDLNRDTNDFNMIRNAIAELEADQESIERQQKHEELKEAVTDVVVGIWEALFPESIYEAKIGLSEYESKRQDFYQLVTTYNAEKLDEAKELSDTDLQKQQDKYKALTEQSLQVEAQLTEAKQRITELEEERDQAVEERNLAEELLSEAQTELSTVRNEVTAKQNDITRLTGIVSEQETEIEKLREQQKPKSEPSQKLQELIQNVKTKSYRDLDPDDMVKRWEDRQATGGKIHVPLIGGEPEGATFRQEDHTTESDRVDEVVSEQTDGVTFPDDPASSGVSGEAEGANRETVAFNAEEEVAKLKEILSSQGKRIDRLEDRANINREVA